LIASATSTPSTIVDEISNYLKDIKWVQEGLRDRLLLYLNLGLYQARFFSFVS
jgi:hypothetical protein